MTRYFRNVAANTFFQHYYESIVRTKSELKICITVLLNMKSKGISKKLCKSFTQIFLITLKHLMLLFLAPPIICLPSLNLFITTFTM